MPSHTDWARFPGTGRRRPFTRTGGLTSLPLAGTPYFYLCWGAAGGAGVELFRDLSSTLWMALTRFLSLDDGDEGPQPTEASGPVEHLPVPW